MSIQTTAICLKDVSNMEIDQGILEFPDKTPTKQRIKGDCVSPNANLKLLAAISCFELNEREKVEDDEQMNMNCDTPDPEIVKQFYGDEYSNDSITDSSSSYDCSLENELLYEDEVDVGQNSIQQTNFSTCNRKNKSLGVLCHKFVSLFPDNPDPKKIHEIPLDIVAKQLDVERRRIYDIVNVLESIELVSRYGKNKYLWHGRTNIPYTLAKLLTLAQKEGFVEYVDYMHKRSLSSNTKLKNFPSISDTTKDHWEREKSMGILSQKFLMLFLIFRGRVVSMELASRVLMGDINSDLSDSTGSKYKTKIRRLYDIANILASVGLVEKVFVTNEKGRKPGYKYIGPPIAKLSDDEKEQISMTVSKSPMVSQVKPPITRHSYLTNPEDPIPKSFLPKTRSASALDDNSDSSSTDTSSKPFSKHFSFEHLVQVSNMELEKLKNETNPQERLKSRQTSENLISSGTIGVSAYRHYSLSRKIAFPSTIKPDNGRKIAVCQLVKINSKDNNPITKLNSNLIDENRSLFTRPVFTVLQPTRVTQTAQSCSAGANLIAGPPNLDFKRTMGIISPVCDSNQIFFQPTPNTIQISSNKPATANLKTAQKVQSYNMNVARRLKLNDTPISTISSV